MLNANHHLRELSEQPFEIINKSLAKTVKNSCYFLVSSMVAGLNLVLLVFSLPLSVSAAVLGRVDESVLGQRLPSRFGSQGVNLWKLQREKARVLSSASRDGGQHALGTSGEVPDAQYFTQPLDHFDESVNKTFGQR